jgi:molybdopterin molybdotransferase
MPEFLQLVSPPEALQRWLSAVPAPTPGKERIRSADSLGRVLASPVVAPHPLPEFARTTVDGYAVRAEDTFGASASAPSYLRLVGEVEMGKEARLTIAPGQAALVHTGGAIPEGANAVVMLEDTQPIPGDEIEVAVALGVGRNIIAIGEDVRSGDTVIEPGTRLRPQEIGGLMALGIVDVEVYVRPDVAVISTGDEVVPPERRPAPGQVRDVNTHTLSALVSRCGGSPRSMGIVPDDFDELLATAARARDEADLVVITAGSSASSRDNTAEVIRRLGSPGVLVHGLSIRPGKPTILGVADGKPVVGLPGNPVSALVVAGLFVPPVLRRLGGESRPQILATTRAVLANDIPSEAGRHDYVPVRLVAGPAGWIAEPVFGKSNLIFTLVRADGLVRIPAEANGLARDAQVEVIPFEPS